MNITPKLQKRETFSLRKGISNKSLFGVSKSEAIARNYHNGKSNSAANVENTPPSKTMHYLNDSQSLDSSQSSITMSPTFDMSSPEVGWKWNNKYDSSKRLTKRQARYNRKRLRRNSATEQDFLVRGGEKLQILERIKHRCERLNSDLSVTEHVAVITDQNHCAKLKRSIQAQSTPKATSKRPQYIEKDAFKDFMNDSADDLLLQASQQVEMEPKAEAAKLEIPQFADAKKKTPKSSNSKHNRSSFYMQFLEEETPEDWLAAIDAAVQQASIKGTRTTLQRYNSMPTTTITTMSSNVISSKQNSPIHVVAAALNKSNNLKRHRTVCR